MQDRLILDIASEFEKFRLQVKPLVTDFRAFAKETITSILEYIHGASEGLDMLQVFVDTLEEVAEDESVDEEGVQAIKDACYELGMAIFKNLQDIGAYDEDGELAFKFKEILGKDIVLEPLEPEDFIGGDSPEHEGDDVDGSDEEDRASLYEDLIDGDSNAE